MVDLRARGHDLFFGRAGCSACHSVAGEGGRIIGPDLGQVTDLDRTVRSILTPDAEIAPGYARGVMPSLAGPGGPLDDDDVLAIAVYLTFRRETDLPDPAAVAGAQDRLAEARALR